MPLALEITNVRIPPKTMPVATWMSGRRRIVSTARHDCDPSATRIPISRVRRETATDITA
jgi:hypothetical protein